MIQCTILYRFIYPLFVQDYKVNQTNKRNLIFKGLCFQIIFDIILLFRRGLMCLALSICFCAFYQYAGISIDSCRTRNLRDYPIMACIG